MSQITLLRCDGCGTIFGEGGYNEKGWARISPPDNGFAGSRDVNLCANCWNVVKPHIPSLGVRPSHPGRVADVKSGHQV